MSKNDEPKMAASVNRNLFVVFIVVCFLFFYSFIFLSA